jgi:hypothetical protein
MPFCYIFLNVFSIAKAVDIVFIFIYCAACLVDYNSKDKMLIHAISTVNVLGWKLMNVSHVDQFHQLTRAPYCFYEQT